MAGNSRRKRGNRRSRSSPEVSWLSTALGRPQETVAVLLNDMPRKGAVVNVLSSALTEGFLLCALIGGIVAWGTSNFISDKLWVYVANTALAMFVKVLWAWLYVVWGRNFFIKVALQVTRRSFGRTPENVKWPEGLPDQANTTVLIVTVATAFATILATEQFNPDWVSYSINIVWLTGLAGAMTAMTQSLSVPSNIQALLKNQHHYQEGSERDRGRRR